MKPARTLLVIAAAFSSVLANAQILAPSQTGNASVDLGSDDPPFLTVNWFNGEQNVGLLQFDLSSLSGPVTSADLHLWQWANASNSAQFGLFLNTSAWTPASVGGDLANLPSTSGEIAELDLTDFNSQVWRTVDISTVASEWADGSIPNYGLTLERIDQDNPVIYFGATDGTEFGRPNFAPFLEVNGGSTVPDGSPAWVIEGIAFVALVLFGRRRALFSRA